MDLILPSSKWRPRLKKTIFLSAYHTIIVFIHCLFCITGNMTRKLTYTSPIFVLFFSENPFCPIFSRKMSYNPIFLGVLLLDTPNIY